MKRAVFNAVGKVMGNENLGKVSYDNKSAFGANENSISSLVLLRPWWLERNVWSRLDTHKSATRFQKRISTELYMVKCCIPMCPYGLQAVCVGKYSLKISDMSPNTDRLERTDASTMNEDEYAELGFRHNLCHWYNIRDHAESKIKLVRQREESQKIMEDKQARRRYARGNPSNPYQQTHFRISYNQPQNIAKVFNSGIYNYSLEVDYDAYGNPRYNTFHCDQWKTHMYGSTWSNPDYTLTKPDSWSGLFWRKSDY